LALVLAGCAKPATETPATGVDEAIGRVTAGLRPGIVIKDSPPAKFRLADRLAHHRVPGVSIAVVDSGRLAWARGFGLKEAGTADSVTATTLFQAASISKPVAATVMLRLVDEGKLALDSAVNGYLRSWKLPDNKFTLRAPVTLRRIVSHNAGLTIHGFPGYATGASVPTLVQILDGVKPANTGPVRVDTFPGAISRYSGGGTTLMQLVLTEVTGEPFASLAKRLVLDPIGMTNSTYEQPLPAALRGREAAAHEANGSVTPGRWHTYPEQAPAGLWTTPTDLVEWAMEIAAAREGKSTKVISKATATEMLIAQKAPFGLGPSLEGSGRGFRFGHGGSNQGFRCQLVYFPETGQGAAVMTNGEQGDRLVTEILLALAAEYHWPDYGGPKTITPLAVDSTVAEQFVGDYHTPTPFPVTITVKRTGAKLFVEATVGGGGLSPEEVVFTDSTRVTGLESGIDFSFGKGRTGRIDRLEIGGIKLARK
jgi:CubicO group peptidase (beta-lactamase class C family)